MALASYLLFEPEFTAELVELGKHDAFQHAERLRALFDPETPEMDEDSLNKIQKSLRDFFDRFTR